MAGAVYTADFETCDNRAATGGTPTFARVWLWALCDISSKSVETGNCIGTFMERIQREGCTLWFHNLAYDGAYIVDWLLRHGYAHTQNDVLPPSTFKAVISAKGKWYQLVIVSECGIRVTINDSLKKYPFSIRAMGEQFGFPEQKGVIDYTSWRGEDYRAGALELEYIASDVLIDARAMEQAYNEGADKLTIGSDCMAAFKEDIGKRQFNMLFPSLNPIQDGQMRKAYRGGYCYVNPVYKGVDVYGGISVDFNSMYPSMMLAKPFPVGRPRYFTGRYIEDARMPLYIQALTVMFHVKQGGFPMLQIHNSGYFGAHEYVEKTEVPVSLWFSSVDLQLFLDNYNADILSWDGGYKFEAAQGMFDGYMNYWREVKEASTGIVRTRAKLYLNNLYGKFGTNPDATLKIPKLPDAGAVRYELGPQETRPPVYVPVAVFATAWARDTLIRAAMANRERFIYCDTDSLHLLGTEPPAACPLDDVKFGFWKVEGEFSHARHLRTKAYIWDLSGEVSVKCAGMPDNIKADCTFDNFHIGYSNLDENGRIRPGLGKLHPLLVRGGRTLIDRPYQLR